MSTVIGSVMVLVCISANGTVLYSFLGANVLLFLSNASLNK